MIPVAEPARPYDTIAHVLGLVADKVAVRARLIRDGVRAMAHGMADDAALGRGYDEGVKAAARMIGQAGGVDRLQVERILDRDGALGGMVEIADNVTAERKRLAEVFGEDQADARHNAVTQTYAHVLGTLRRSKLFDGDDLHVINEQARAEGPFAGIGTAVRLLQARARLDAVGD